MCDAPTTATYTCAWCRNSSDGPATTCPSCGAPVDIRADAPASGWTQLPPIPDMTRIQFGQLVVPDRGRLRPGGRHEPGAATRACTSAITSCCGRTRRSS